MGSFKFELGQTVEDVVTGQQGVIVGCCQNMASPNTYGFQPRATEPDKCPAPAWVLEGRLRLVDATPIVLP